MATLEVHDARGRVQFIELTHDHPVTFGTSVACDIALDGPGIRPVHGRIRWKGKRYKVEASPDAEYILLNGTKMTSSGLHHGDEIVVGPCRMILKRPQEPDPRARPRGSKQGPAPADQERTPVVAAPVIPRESERRGPRTPERGRAPERALPPRHESLLERDDWLYGLQKDRPPRRAREHKEEEDSRPYPIAGTRGRHQTKDRETQPAEPRPRKSLAGALGRLRRLGGQSAPGRERIASSPLVLSLVAALAVLVALGFWLRATIASNAATRNFNSGVQDFEAGDYRTAQRSIDQVLAANRHDPRSGKARVLRALANVRQFVTPDGSTWSAALEAAQEMVDKVGKLPEFRDEQVELAEIILRIGEGIADRARRGPDPAALAEAESTVELHARVGGPSAADFLNRSRLPSKLAEARAAVRKAQVFAAALAEMDKALLEHAAPRVYQARDKLVDQYTDLARDAELIKRMTAANDLVKKGVTVDSTRRRASREQRVDPLGPPTSLVLRLGKNDSGTPPSPELIAYAVADGYAYALDGTTGAALWHIPIGLGATFLPQAVPGDTTVLVFDSRFDELLQLDARTGALNWRLGLGEPVRDPPLVFGNQLAQVLPGGKLLLVDLKSGAVQSTVNLGRPLARTPTLDELGQRLYVLGRQDCLFVLSRDPLSCSAVEYLGHLDDAVPCAPARVGRFLIVPENVSLSESRWHILVLDEDGARVHPVQELRVSGWTWGAPASSGSVVWAIGDKGGYEAFGVGDYGSKQPFRPIARLTADATATGPAFALARSERELWVASGHAGQFALDLERASIQPKTPLAQPGPALGPIQVAGTMLVFTFQDETAGGVALLGIDSGTGTVAWRTVVGARWPSALAAAPASAGLTALGGDGREIMVSREQIARGGFVQMPLPRPGDFALPAGTRLEFQINGKALAAVVPEARSDLLWIQEPGKSPGWRKLTLPSPPAAQPLAWGDSVLVPGQDNRAYLIDPVSARSSAEPFVPRFDRDHQGTWLAPARLDAHTVVLADDVGRVRRLTLRTTPVRRLYSEAEVTLQERIIADPATTGASVLIATAGRHVRALAARDLSPVGSWDLSAPLSGAPVVSHETGFVMDRAGGVMAFARDGQRIWSISVGAEVVGSPLVRGQSVWIVTSDGTLHVRALSDGSKKSATPLGILPYAGVIEAGKSALVAAGRATIRPLREEPAGGLSAKP
jgi:outer membrane protein assembly factor BamB